MTKNKKMIENAKMQLQEVQKKARARLLTENDITEIIETAINKLQNDEEAKKYKKYLNGITFENIENLPNNYKYSAEYTKIYGKINKYGNIEKIKISRSNCGKRSFGCGSGMEYNLIFE